MNNSPVSTTGKIVALAGGVGGAKLAHGLLAVLPPDSLTVVVNTADDFRYWGLDISPDLDTVMYTLAGIANEQTGWGIAGETWNALGAIGRLGGETWFQIGDRDLATHVTRTDGLRSGKSLSEVTGELAAALGIPATLLPMTDERVATLVQTPDGWLGFQDYFVRRQHRDQVLATRFEGIEHATIPAGVREAITTAGAIIFCPSNPIVSIGPILAIPGMRDLLARATVPRIAVSPIVGGKALKGPAETMLKGLGHRSSALGVAQIYRGLVDAMVVDTVDAADVSAIQDLGMSALVVDSVMRTIDDRRRLAGEIVDWCSRQS